MKKILFFAAFLLFAGVSLTAQKDAKKSCDKPCTHSEKASVDANDDVSSAVVAAKNDENITVKTCETSGNVSFYRKDVCEQSGKVSYTEVEYLETSGEFAVRASNDEKEGTVEAKAPVKVKAKPGCSSKASKSCGPAGKAKSGCCSSKSAKKSCSSKS